MAKIIASVMYRYVFNDRKRVFNDENTCFQLFTFFIENMVFAKLLHHGLSS